MNQPPLYFRKGGFFYIQPITKEVMHLKNPRAFKDRRRSISVVKMAGTNPNGRYGILTTGTVPAVSIMNGA